MTPFFGGSVKQNVEDNANTEMFENFTGTSSNYQKKKEAGTFFKPEPNVSNPYGTNNLDGYMNDRYIVGDKRHNVAPIQQVQVGTVVFLNQPIQEPLCGILCMELRREWS